MERHNTDARVAALGSATFGRRTLFAGLGVAGLLALAGCSIGSRPSPVTAGSVSLSMWTHDPSYVEAFTRAATDKVLMKGSAFAPTISPVSADGASLLSRTITQAVAGSEGPDLLGIIISEFPRVMKSQMAENLFVDLNPLIEQAGGNILRTADYSVDGKTYALESDTSISVFYYRADEFERLGIDSRLATWEEYLEVGGAVFAETGQSIGMVSNGDNTSIYNSFLQYLLQRGGSPFDESGELTIDTDEAADVLEFMATGVENGSLMVIGDPYGSAAASALKSSTLIGTVMPSWYNVYGLQANAPEQAGSWRMRTLPRFASGGHIASMSGGTGFAVGVNSANREAALDLLRRIYLTREGQLLRYEIGGYLPTMPELYDAPEFQSIEDEFLGGQRVFETFSESANDMPTFYQSATAQQLSVAMGAPLLDLYSGKKNPAQVIEASIAAYKQQTRQA